MFDHGTSTIEPIMVSLTVSPTLYSSSVKRILLLRLAIPCPVSVRVSLLLSLVPVPSLVLSSRVSVELLVEVSEGLKTDGQRLLVTGLVERDQSSSGHAS
jgi:hypothetical protein